MKKLLPFFALLCASVGWFGFRRHAAPPDLSTPKSTVRAFVAALIAKDTDALAACVQGATASDQLKDLLRNDTGLTAQVNGIEVKDIIAEATGDQAKVAVEVTLQAPSSQDRDAPKVTLSLVELFQVRRQNEQWIIVPDEVLMKQLADLTQFTVRYDLRPMASMAALVASPAVAIRNIHSARDRARSLTCLSNEKQLALGVLQYVQDYDEMFPRKKTAYKELIFPYVKNNEIFTCPSDAKGTISYAMNSNMQGAILAAVNSPAQTVLFYEGKNMQFDFKHDGRTAVAFADGHAKLLTPEEAKNVFWYPSGKNPPPPKPARPQTKPRAAGKRKPSR